MSLKKYSENTEDARPGYISGIPENMFSSAAKIVIARLFFRAHVFFVFDPRLSAPEITEPQCRQTVKSTRSVLQAKNVRKRKDDQGVSGA